jgi:peptidoglycan hydrolase-like protein with peptidoglycan-binding domain
MLTRLAFSVALAASTFVGTAAFAADDTAPLQIFVSKDTQTLVVYDGDQIVASTNVSTGKRGHTTPSGIFSILEKKKMHHSNLYDDAPMPWMQRITWSGVALHEGSSVPDYPASHGCVRLPKKFAKMLFPMTKRGYHVIISDRELVPQRITAADLFVPRFAQPEADLLSDAELRPAVPGDGPVEVASNDALPKNGALAVAALPKNQPAIKMLITRVSDRQKIADAQALLARLGYYDGPHDGGIGPKTRDAVKAYQEVHGQKPTGMMDQAFYTSIHKVMNRKPLTGWLSVRRNFKPVFDAPVDLDQPEVALGTHFYTAIRVNPAQNTAEWYATTLENHISEKAARRLGITLPADALAPEAAETAIERVAIPSELREKIETMLGNGSSLTITDIGTESETGQGTDFITVVKPAPQTEG